MICATASGNSPFFGVIRWIEEEDGGWKHRSG